MKTREIAEKPADLPVHAQECSFVEEEVSPALLALARGAYRLSKKNQHEDTLIFSGLIAVAAAIDRLTDAIKDA